ARQLRRVRCGAFALALLCRKRPCNVLAHERRGVVGAVLERAHDLRAVGRVAEPDREIAQPALVTDAPDCATLRARFELLLAPGEQRDELGVVQSVAHVEVGVAVRLRILVPWTDELAVVAAVDTVAD